MTDTAPVDISADLYALVVYLNVSANRELLHAIAREQLSFNQLQALEWLRSGRRPTIGQLAMVLHVSRPAASQIVSSLARRDLVRREGDEKDGRAKRVHITDDGEEALLRLHAVRREHVDRFASELDADESGKLEAALSELLQREELAACRPQPEPV